jgi:nicotinamidase-related amidase
MGRRRALLPHALPMAENIAALKKRAQEANVPVVYVNDNFGQWRSDTYSLIQHCTEDDVRGKPVVSLLRPDKDDYFVLKPKHSGFFSPTSTSARLLGCQNPDTHRHGGRHLRLVHRQRRLHARLQHRDTGRLHCV